MNHIEINHFLIYKLGLTVNDFAKLLNKTPAAVELILSGELKADGETVLRIHELDNKISIPRVHQDKVKEILNDGAICNQMKAEKIHRFDYDMTSRETNSIVDRYKLMHVNTIRTHIDNRLEMGVV